jgi:hypothetical protein
MTRFRQSAFEVIVAIVFIALGTLIVHLVTVLVVRISRVALVEGMSANDEGTDGNKPPR